MSVADQPLQSSGWPANMCTDLGILVLWAIGIVVFHILVVVGATCIVLWFTLATFVIGIITQVVVHVWGSVPNVTLPIMASSRKSLLCLGSLAVWQWTERTTLIIAWFKFVTCKIGAATIGQFCDPGNWQCYDSHWRLFGNVLLWCDLWLVPLVV